TARRRSQMLVYSLLLLGWGLLLDDPLEVCQRAAPEPVQFGAQRADAARVDCVDVPVAGALVDLPRDRRTADGELCRQLTDRAWPMGEALQDGAARRI